MTMVMQSLRQDHANMALLLQALERQLERLREGGTADFDIVRASLDYCLEFPEQAHHPKENLLLQALRRRNPAAARAVGGLEDEHRALNALTHRFSDLIDEVLREHEIARDLVVRAWDDFIESYHRHMAREERTLFVEARRWLTDEDWLVLGDDLVQQADPVFGAAVERRFRALRADIEDAEEELRALEEGVPGGG